jgi:hypothetical protein
MSLIILYVVFKIVFEVEDDILLHLAVLEPASRRPEAKGSTM